MSHFVVLKKILWGGVDFSLMAALPLTMVQNFTQLAQNPTKRNPMATHNENKWPDPPDQTRGLSLDDFRTMGLPQFGEPLNSAPPTLAATLPMFYPHPGPTNRVRSLYIAIPASIRAQRVATLGTGHHPPRARPTP